MIIAGTSCKQAAEKEEKVKAPELDLHAAVLMNDLNAIKQHIAAGSDLNVIEPTAGSTPLISSIVFARDEISSALIEAGVDLSLKNNEGSDALFVAALFCRLETLKHLIEKGADINTRNLYGSSALETAELPYEVIKPVYEEISKGLGPLGLKLDMNRIEAERIMVAEILKSAN